MSAIAHSAWKNVETWALRLLLINDETTCRVCQSLAIEARLLAEGCPLVEEGIWRAEDALTYLLAERLQEYLEQRTTLAIGAHPYRQLLGAVIAEVDWQEIAESFLET